MIHLPPDTGAFARAMLNQRIEAVEHILHQFCQPAYLRYHHANDRDFPSDIAAAIRHTQENPSTHLQYNHRDTVIELSLLEIQSIKHRLEIFQYLAGPFYNCEAYNVAGGPSLAACEKLRKCFEGLLRCKGIEVLNTWAHHIWVIDAPMSYWTENGSLESYELSGYRSACPINMFQVFSDGEAPRFPDGPAARSPFGEALIEIGGQLHAVPTLNRIHTAEEHWIVGRQDNRPRWNPRHIEPDASRSVEDGISRIRERLTDERVNITCLCGNVYEGDIAETTVEPRCPECAARMAGQNAPQNDEEVDAFIAEIDALMAEDDTEELPPEGTLPKAAPTG